MSISPARPRRCNVTLIRNERLPIGGAYFLPFRCTLTAPIFSGGFIMPDGVKGVRVSRIESRVRK